MIEISAGTANDIASIMPVMNSSFDPAFGEAWSASQCMSLLAIPGSKLIIAKDGKNCIGFAMTRWVLDEEELLMIAVSPAFQRDNVASRILEMVIDGAKTGGRIKLFLEVRDGNHAQDFYQASAFIEMGRRKNYYRGIDGKLFDAITMALMLS